MIMNAFALGLDRAAIECKNSITSIYQSVPHYKGVRAMGTAEEGK